MRRALLTAALFSAAFLVTACAAPDSGVKEANQPHLKPPEFQAPVTAPTSGTEVRYCGVRMVGGGEDVCAPDEFCRRTIADMCGAADAPGICTSVPKMCTMDFNPVCGCDGKTYSNECTANSVGVSAASAGRCQP